MPNKVILCYICNWNCGSLHVYSLVDGYIPWELWKYWVAHIVPPVVLQTPLAPWVLSLAPSLRTLCSVQWLAENVPHCICHALAESPR